MTVAGALCAGSNRAKSAPAVFAPNGVLVGSLSGLGGSGMWNPTDSVWWDGEALQAWIPGDTAVFTGTAGDVLLEPGLSAGGLVFQSSGYQLSGGTLSLTSGDAPFPPLLAVQNVGFGTNQATVQTQLLGSQGFTKTGDGTLRLDNLTNSFTGPLLIQAGTLVIEDPRQIGPDLSAVSISGVANSGNPGFSGGSLFLAGNLSSVSGPGMDFSRSITAAGRGPGAANGSGALISLGYNTLSGSLALSSAGAGETRAISVYGATQLTGSLFLGSGAPQVLMGNGNWVVSGKITGSESSIDRFIKSGQIISSTLWLQNPENNFAQSLRIDSGTVRVSTGGALGIHAGTQAVDFFSGTLEVRSDLPGSFSAKNLSVRSGGYGALFLDHSIDGPLGIGPAALLQNQAASFGVLSFFANSTFNFSSRNGWSASFSGQNGTIGGGQNGFSTLQNSGSGLLTLNGDLWGTQDTTDARTWTLQSAGDTLVSGRIQAVGNLHTFQKTGSGTVSFARDASNLPSTLSGRFTLTDGTTEVRTAEIFGSSRVLLNGGALRFLGASGTGAGETWSQNTFDLAGTNAYLVAQQSGTEPGPLRITSNFAASNPGAKTLHLGGDAPGSAANQIAGLIPNSGSLTNVLKFGTGTWEIAAPAAGTGSAATIALEATGDTDSALVKLTAENSTAGLVVGQPISGPGIPAGTRISQIVDSTTLILSQNRLAQTPAGAADLHRTTGLEATLSTNAASTGTNNPVLSLDSTAGLVPGQQVVSSNLPAQEAWFIRSISGPNSITLASATGASKTLGAIPATESLTFAQAPNFSGTLTLTAGTLRIRSGSVLSPSTPLLFDVDPVTRLGLAGGTFEWTSGISDTATLGRLSALAGHGVLRIPEGTGSLSFLGVAARASGATLNFQPGTGSIQFTTPPALANGILPGYATFNGTDWVTFNGSQIAPFSSYTSGLPTSGALSGAHYLSTTDTGTTAAQTIQSLKLIGAQTLSLGGALSFAANPGGLLFDNSAGPAAITGAFPLGTAGQELVITTNGSNPTDALTIAAPIGSGGSSLTKTGTGLLVVSGPNVYTGNTTINQGTLRLSGPTATLGAITLPSNTTVLRQDTVLDLNGAGPALPVFPGGPIFSTVVTGTLSGAGRVTNLHPETDAALWIGQPGVTTASSTFGGVLSDGNRPLHLVKNGSGTQSLVGLQTYTGRTILNGGILAVTRLADGDAPSGIGASSNAPENLVFNNGTLQYTGAGTAGGGIYQTTQTPSVSTNRLFSFAGNAGIQSSGTFGNESAAAGSGANHASLVFSNTNPLGFLTSGSKILTLGGTSTGDNLFQPRITDNPLDGSATALTKADSGLWILQPTTSNSYSGTTTVSGGTLRALDGFGIPAQSLLSLQGGIFETSGLFTRELGAGLGQIQIPSGASGFAAATPDRLRVRLGSSGLSWGGASFHPTALVLGSGTALGETEFLNDIALNGTGRTLTVQPNFTTGTMVTAGIVSGVLSDGTTASGITKNGAGVLILGGANRYTGNTTIQDGTLVVNSIGNATGTAASSLGASGGTLVFSRSAGDLNPLLYVGPGESATRPWSLDGNLGSADRTWRLDASGSGPLELAGVFSNTTQRDATLRTLYLELRGTNIDNNSVRSRLSDSAALSNPARLGINKVDGGTWILNPAEPNLFTGPIRVFSGSLGLTAAGIGASTALSLNNGSIFAYGGPLTVQAVVEGNNSSAVFAGQNPITLAGTGGVALRKTAGPHSWTVSNNLENGALLTIQGNFQNLETSTNLSATQTLFVRGYGSTVWNGVIAENTDAGGRIGLDVAIGPSASLTLAGPANTYTGPTTLSQGALILSKDPGVNPLGASSLFTWSGGTLSATTPLQDSSAILTPVRLSGSPVVFDGTQTIELAATLTNSGGNRLVFNQIASPAALLLSAPAAVNLSESNTGRTLTLAGSGNTQISGTIQNGGTGAGNLVFSGTGSLTLSGANTFSGSLTVNRGTVFLTGTQGNLGSLSTPPGAGLILNSGGVFQLDASVSNRLANSAITLQGGTFSVQNLGSTESFGHLRVAAGRSRILLPDSGALSFASADFPSPGSHLDLTQITGLGSGPRLLLGTLPLPSSNGILPRVLIGETDFAAYDPTQGVVPFTAYPSISDVNAALRTDTLKLGGHFSNLHFSNGRTVNALALTDSTPLAVSVTGDAPVLTLASGAVLASGGTLHRITAPQLHLGSHGFFQIGTQTTLELTGSMVAGNSLSKTLPGTLVLSGKQFLNSATTILDGTLRLGAGHSTLFPGTSALILDAGATLDLNGTIQQFAGLFSPGVLPGAAGQITSTTGSGTLLAGNAESIFAGSITGNSVHFVRTPGQNTTTFESPHTYGGTTTVLGGSLDLRDDGALLRTSAVSLQYARLQLQNNSGLFVSHTDRLPDTAPISLRGADLRLNGRFNDASRELLGPVTLAEGANTLAATAGGGSFWSTELSIEGLSRLPATTLNFLGSNPGQSGNSSRFLFRNQPGTFQNGFLGSWAIVNSTDYAAFHPATGIGAVGQGGYVPYDATFGPGRLTQIPVTAPTVTTLPSGTTTAAVLRLAGAFQNDLAFTQASDTLNLELGGILRSDNNSASTIGSPAIPGILTAGGNELSGVRELVLYGNQNTLTIHSVIADNGLGNRVQLVKSGANAVVLTAPSTFSGGTVVNQGVLQLSPAVPGVPVLPVGLLTINGGSNFTAATVNAQATNAIAAGSSVVLNGRAALNFAANTGHVLDSLQFNNRGGDASPMVSLGAGATLALTGPAPLVASSQNPLFVATVTGGTLLFPGGATPVFTAPVTLPDSGAVFNEFVPSLNLASTLASASAAQISSVTKTGSGLLLLSGANTFSGGVQIAEGGIVLGRDTAASLSAGLFSGPLGTGVATFAPGTRLLVNNTSRVLLNPVVFSEDPRIESTGLNSATLQLAGSVTFENLQTTGTRILLPNPSVNVVLRGALSGMESLTALGSGSGPGSLRVSGLGNVSGFNFTNLRSSVPVHLSGLTSGTSFSLLHDGDGTGSPQILSLGSFTWNAPADALLTLTVDRAGGTPYFATAVNKTLAPASFSAAALSNGLTVNNNNGFGLLLSDPIALSATSTFSVSNASASNAVQGLTLAGRISGASSMVKAGAGTLVLSNPLNTFTGSIQITRGVLATDSDAALGDPSNAVLLAPSTGTAAFRANSSFETARSFVLANTANTRALEVVGGSVLRLNTPFSFAGDASASLTKNETGILVLAADNTAWTGALTVNGGAVRALHSAAFGSGTVQVTGNFQAAIQVAGNVTLANPLALNTGTTSMPFGGLQFGGQLENVSGNNTWSGPITTLGDASIGSTSGTLTLTGGIQMGASVPRALFFTGAGNIHITGSPLAPGAAAAWNRIEKFGSGTLQFGNTQTLPLSNDSFRIHSGRILFSEQGSLAVSSLPPPAAPPTFSGFQLFQGATLELDNSSVSMSNRLGSSSVQFRGGNFVLRGGASGPVSESVASPLFTRGLTVVSVLADPTQPVSLLFNNGTTAASFASTNNAPFSNAGATGASVLFRGSQLGSPQGPGVATISGIDAGFAYTGQSGPVGARNKGILPWALADRSESGSGTAFATSDGINAQTGGFTIRPLAASEYETANVASANSNLLLNSGFTSAGASNLTVNSITLEAGAQLGMGSRLSLTNASGGILVRNGASHISGGILSQPAGQAVLNFWTLGDLSISSLLHGGNGTRSGSISFVKAGAGTLTLATPLSDIPFLAGTSANSFTGHYVINQGTIRLQGGTNTIPANNYLALNGGTLDLNGNSQLFSSLFTDSILAGGLLTSSSGRGTLILNNDSGSRTFAGTSSGSLLFARSGDGAMTFTNAIAHAGGTVFNGGTSTFTHTGRLTGNGPVSIQYATVLFRNDGTEVLTDRLSDTAPLSLQGGTLQFVGRPQADTRETAGALSLVAGHNNLFAATPGTGVNSLDVTFADLSRPAGSTALLRLNDQGNKGLMGSRARIFFNRIQGTSTDTPQAGLSRDLIGPWAFVDREFASYHPSFGVGPINGQGFAGSSPTPLTAFPAFTENIRFAGTGTTVLTGNTGVNTLTFASPTANSVLDLGGFTLRSAAGGILFAQSTNNAAIQIVNGSITAGTPGVPADFYLTHANYGGLNRSVRISANLVDNGPGGAVRVVKSSGDTAASFMTWDAPANSYTGGTVVSLGTLLLDGPGITIPAAADPRRGLEIHGPGTVTMVNRPGQIAASNVVTLIGNATLNLYGDNTLEGLVFDNSGGGFATPLVNTFGLLPESGSGAPGILTIGNAGITATSSNPSFNTQLGAAVSAGIAGRIQFGSTQKTVTVDPILLDGRSVAPLVPTFHLQGIVDSPAGFLKAGNGILQLSAPQIFTGPLTVLAGGIALGSQNAGSRFSTLDLRSGAILNLSGYSTTLGALEGSGDVFSDRGSATLSVGFNHADTVFSGQFRRFNDALLGGVSLSKVGSGTLTLSGVQSNATASTGTVSVQDGTLAFSGAGAWFQGVPASPTSGALSGSFQIQSGGTLLLDNTGTRVENRLGLRDTGTLTLQGGELRFLGNPTEAVTESVSSLTFQQGNGIVTLVPQPATATTFAVGTLSAAGNSSAGLFRGISHLPGPGTATVSIAVPNLIANQGAGLNGSKTIPIRHDLLGDASPSGLGTGFLVRDSNTNFWRPLAQAELELSPLLWGDNVNAGIASHPVRLSSGAQANSLTLSGSVLLGSALDPAFFGAFGGGTGLLGLRLSDASALLALDGTNATLDLGSLTTGSANTGVTHVLGNAVLTLNGYLGIGSTGGWNKSGSGRFRLNQRALYTGATTINGGTLELNAGLDHTLAVVPGTTVPALTALQLNGASTVLDLMGRNQAVGSLQNNGGANPLPGAGGTIRNSGDYAVFTSVGGGTFAGSLLGNLGFTRAGNSTTLLTAPQNYTGPTVVRGGNLQLRDSGSVLQTSSISLFGGSLHLDSNGLNPNGLPNLQRISAGTPVVIRGGSVQITGTGSADVTTQIGSLSVLGGANLLAAMPLINSGSTVTVTVGNLIRNEPQAMLSFQGWVGTLNGNAYNVETLGGQGLSRDSRIFIQQLDGTPFAQNRLSNNLIGGWAVADGNSFATYRDGVGVMVMGSTVQGIAAPGFDGTDISGIVAPTHNISDSSLARTLSTSRTVHSLRLASGGAQTISLDANVALSLNVGLITNSGSPVTITGTDATSTLSGPDNGLLYLWINQQPLLLHTVLSGSSGLVKSGGGNLTLNPVGGSNTYSGPTFFQGGSVTLNGDAGELLIPGNLTIENAAVSLGTLHPGQIASSSSVSILGGGSLALANYTTSVTQSLARLSFSNLGGNSHPTLSFGTPSGTGTTSTLVLTAADAITALNDSLAFTPLISTGDATRSGLQFAHPNPVIHTSGLSTNSLDIQVPITGAAGPLTKTGPGSLTLRGASTFQTGLTLSGGSLILGASSTPSTGTVTSGPLGTGTLTIQDGTALLSDGTPRSIANPVVVNGNFNFSGVTAGNSVSLTGSIQLGNATRTIHVASPAVVGTLSGSLSSSASGDAILKTGPGILTLGSSLSAGFGVQVAEGILRLSSATSLPARVQLASGSALDLNGLTLNNPGFLGGTGFLTNSHATAATLVLGGSSVSDVSSNYPLQFDFPLSDSPGSLLHLTKAGLGTLTLTRPNANFGNFTVVGGTLRAQGTRIFSPNATVQLGNATTGARTVTLDTGAADQTLGGLQTGISNAAAEAQVLVASGTTLTLAGPAGFSAFVPSNNATVRLQFPTSGGNLVVSHPNAHFLLNGFSTSPGATGSHQIHLGGLASFTANVSRFAVGEGNANLSLNSTLTLAPLNQITASTGFFVGRSQSGAGGTTAMVQLGQSNSLFVGAAGSPVFTGVSVGTDKASGTVQFAAGLSNPSLVLRGSVGGDSRTDFSIGTQDSSNTATAITGQVLLTAGPGRSAGSIDARIGTLKIGEGSLAGTGTGTGLLEFDRGTIDATTVVLGSNAAGSGSGTGTLKIGGGTLTIGSGGLLLGNKPIGSGNAAGSLLISGGAVSIQGLGIHAGSGSTSVLTLNGGSLDLNGNPIGTAAAPVTQLEFLSGSLRNIGEINGGAGLRKTGSGVLELTGTNAFTGTTQITAGSLLVSSSQALGSPLAGTEVSSGAALLLSNNIQIPLESLTLAGSGPGGLGALRNLSGTNTFAGPLTLTADSKIQSDSGRLNLSSLTAISGVSATLTLAGFGETAISGDLNLGALSKEDSGIAFLNGNSGPSSLLQVLGGEIHIKGAVVNTPSLAVHSGGSLLLSGNRNRISDSAALTLGSGRFGFAPDLNNASESLGTLTLQSGSIIDFGSGSGNTLTFSSIVLGSAFLDIYNWSGSMYRDSSVPDTGSASQDRLLFSGATTGLDPARLPQIRFFSDAGQTFLGAAGQIQFGTQIELVPIPEPGSWLAGGLLLGLAGLRERNRRMGKRRG